MDHDKDFYTSKELADLLGISRVSVFNRIKLGKIKAKKIGRNFIILKQDLPEILNSKLSAADKDNIEKGVKKVLRDYGDTIKLLGKE
jgi:excisionase family DNA binding protein